MAWRIWVVHVHHDKSWYDYHIFIRIFGLVFHLHHIPMTVLLSFIWGQLDHVSMDWSERKKYFGKPHILSGKNRGFRCSDFPKKRPNRIGPLGPWHGKNAATIQGSESNQNRTGFVHAFTMFLIHLRRFDGDLSWFNHFRGHPSRWRPMTRGC